MFDFLKYRFVGLTLSLIVVSFFVGSYVYKTLTRGYAFSYSVEFEGGTQVLLRFKNPVNSKDVRSIIEKKWPESGPVIREFSSEQILVRVKDFDNDVRGLADKMRETVQEAFADNLVTIEKSEAVGPGVGADLRWKSIRAVFLALLLMLLYIAFRFRSFAFAVGAVVALLHDAIMVLGVFLVFDREISISVIGAVLAVLGYSVNDTIVIFSRMRSNLKKMRGASLYEVVNASLNKTFRRTLLTSISTLLTVGSMFVLGGAVMRDFSLALLMVIFFGTYSSIYIASPVMMLLYKEKK